MTNSLTYGGIITKVKAMSSHLVKEADFKRIVELDSIAELINYLRTKPSYEQIFKDVNETTIHRGQIEELMKTSLLMDFGKIYTFGTREQRAFLDVFFLRYEVNILKECLELIYNQKNTLHLAEFQPFFEKHSELNITALAECESLDEYISYLKDTKYEAILSNLHNSNNTISLSDFEAQLDIFCYQRIWKMLNKNFKGKEKKRMLTLFGTQIDILNIMWIYRSKKFYDVSAKEIYLTIIPIHFHLRKEQIVKLVESSGVTEFLSALQTTYYSYLEKEYAKGSIESIYSEQMHKNYKQLLRSASHSMLNVLYYLFLKEEELDHVTTALECIRYNLEPDEAMKYIYSI